MDYLRYGLAACAMACVGWAHLPSAAAAPSTTPAGAADTSAGPALAPPVFSVQGGAYAQPPDLALSHADADVKVYYTFDGSEPSPDRIAGSAFKIRNRYAVTGEQQNRDRHTHILKTFRYHDSLRLTASSAPDALARIATSLHQDEPPYFPVLSALEWHQVWRNRVYSVINLGIAAFNRMWRHVSDSVLPHIDLIEPRQEVTFPKGVVVRAVAVKGKQRSAVVTQTYFIGQGAFTRLPVVSLAGPADRFFSYDDGLLVPGRTFDDWRKQNPTALVEPETPANWNRDHDDVPTNVEYFVQEASGVLKQAQNQLAGVRVHGGLTRVTPNKSMRLYARKKYGASHFDHDFFGNGLRHRRLVLRNSGSDSISTLFRDAVIHEISADLQFEKQPYVPAVVFLNGEYRGIYNLREYQDEHFLADKYGIDPDDLDLMNGNEARHGDDKHWRALVALLEGNALTPAVYAKVLERMDVESFIDYQIANIFFGNTDWPHNNIRYWRHRVPYTPGKPSGVDGRWRWMMFDVDFGMQNHRRDTLRGASSPRGMRNWNDTEWSTLVFRRLLTHPAFRARFEQRFEELLNTRFASDNVVAHIDRARSRIASEIPRHVQRWKSPASVEAWETQIRQLRDFGQKRPEIQRKQLRAFLAELDP